MEPRLHKGRQVLPLSYTPSLGPDSEIERGKYRGQTTGISWIQPENSPGCQTVICDLCMCVCMCVHSQGRLTMEFIVHSCKTQILSSAANLTRKGYQILYVNE